MLRADFRRKRAIFLEDGAPISIARTWLTDGSGSMVLYRTMRWFAGRNLFPIAFLFQWLNKFINGCVIGIGAQFGPGFVIMHPVGIVINSKVRAGENVTIESGVVIGDEKGLSPRLGEHIFIGSGAKIFGEVTVGNHVRIGANAVVTKDAPDGSTMLGIPACPHVSKD